MIAADFFAGFGVCWLLTGFCHAVGYAAFLRRHADQVQYREVLLFIVAGPIMLMVGEDL